jgi:hypothetical protein
MPALEEIQKLVDEALADFINRNFDHVRTVIWPAIKTKIGEYTGLDLSGRRALGWLIYKRLNELTLQAMPTPINVEWLKANLEAGREQVYEPMQVYKWLPW